MPYQKETDAHGIVENPNLRSYLEYPKVMYSPDGGIPVTVLGKPEEDTLAKKGWQPRPFEGHFPRPDGHYEKPADEPKYTILEPAKPTDRKR